MCTFVNSRDDLRRILAGGKEPIESGMPEVIVTTYKKITNILMDKKLLAIDMVRRLQYAIRYNPGTVRHVLYPVKGYGYEEHLMIERMIREKIENSTDVYENFQKTYNSYSDKVYEINIGDNAYRRYFVYKISRDMSEICMLMNTVSLFIKNMNSLLEVMSDITHRAISALSIKLSGLTPDERRKLSIWSGDIYLSDEDMVEMHRDFILNTHDKKKIACTISAIYNISEDELVPLLDHVIKTPPPISGEDTIERIAHLIEAISSKKEVECVD